MNVQQRIKDEAKESRRAERSAHYLSMLDSLLVFESTESGVHIMQAKVIKREAGWTLVVTAKVDSVQKVAFADLEGISDMPEAFTEIVKNSRWKDDKYAVPARKPDQSGT